MPATNKQIRTALIAILQGDATLQTLLGGPGRIKRFQPVGQEQAPMLTYYLYDSNPGSMQSHDVHIQFDAWATFGTGSGGTADDILEQVHVLLTQQKLQAQSIDGWAFRTRGPMDMPTGMDNIVRLMAEYRIHVK